MTQTQSSLSIPNLAPDLEKFPNQQLTTLTIPYLAPNLRKSSNQHQTTHMISDLEKFPNQQEATIIIPNLDPHLQKSPSQKSDHEVEIVDYSSRAQWLRAAVLGANDGLLSTASLMVGMGAVRKDSSTMILTGAAGTVAGACSMAIGEFVSVYSQYDIEMSQIKRLERNGEQLEERRKALPSPIQAAGASAAAFAVGAVVPLLAAAFIRNYKVRLGVVVGAVSLALIGFGWLGAYLGRAPLVKSSLRVLFGGWLAMGITFGLTKLIGSFGI